MSGQSRFLQPKISSDRVWKVNSVGKERNVRQKLTIKMLESIWSVLYILIRDRRAIGPTLVLDVHYGVVVKLRVRAMRVYG